MWNAQNTVVFLPTEREYKILSALWKLGPSTVGEIQTLCSEERPMGYTTALKFLQILLAKKAVTRLRDGRRDVYEAIIGIDEVNRALFIKYLRLIHEGSPLHWVRSALKWKLIKSKDLRRLLIKKKTKVSKKKKK